MALTKRKAPLTLNDKLAAHKAASEAAVFTFQKAADDLESAAAELREAAVQALREADALADLGDHALDAALKNEASAAKIRGLFS